ncbi:MAG: DUF2490 domain-containing protein [Crocinitomicaceae bacterium]|nr:DUF2490 domain-containing protein [Crocinitomicaceae bacterium]
MKRLVVAILFLPLCGFAQNSYKVDAHLWTGLQLNLPVNKDLGLTFETQTRYFKNITSLRQAYGELSANYDLPKGLDLSAAYRYSRVNKEDYFENNNRFCLDFLYNFNLTDALDWKVRFRYQHSFNRLRVINDINPDKEHLLRLKLRVRYQHPEFKRIQPFLSGELFYNFEPPVPGTFLDTYRFRTGLLFDLPDRHEISIFYMFENEFRDEPERNHIYSIQYAYTFKSLKKLFKKKKSDEEKKEETP